MHGEQILPPPLSRGLLLGKSRHAQRFPLDESRHSSGGGSDSRWANLAALDGCCRANLATPPLSLSLGGFRRTNPDTVSNFHWTNPAVPISLCQANLAMLDGSR